MDLNHRPLGYEPDEDRDFNNLQDAGGYLRPCKELLVIVIGQLTDRRVLEILEASTCRSDCTDQFRTAQDRTIDFSDSTRFFITPPVTFGRIASMTEM